MPSIATDRPLLDAVQNISRRTPVGAALSSGEWELVPAEIRMRAMFSARVENERLLAEMQERLRARIEMARRDGRTMDRGVFMEEMREELRRAGYRRGDARRGSLQDLKSTRRLGLIFDMNVAQAQGYARWKLSMTPEGLENEPCWELIRGAARVEIRDWPRIWREAGGMFYDGEGSNDDYPSAPGRMIAKKTDAIWTLISRFGTPWPPFDWGSGMVLRGLDRDESDAFGITRPEETFEPLETPFNSGLSASLAGIPQSGRRRLEDALQGEVEIAGDEIRLLPAPAAVPASLLLPAALLPVIATATETIARWPEKRLTAMLRALERTTAWPRFRKAMADAGGRPQDQDALARAVAQFLAGPDGRAAIAEVRRTASRDAFWCPADFRAVEDIIQKGGAL